MMEPVAAARGAPAANATTVTTPSSATAIAATIAMVIRPRDVVLLPLMPASLRSTRVKSGF